MWAKRRNGMEKRQASRYIVMFSCVLVAMLLLLLAYKLMAAQSEQTEADSKGATPTAGLPGAGMEHDGL